MNCYEIQERIVDLIVGNIDSKEKGIIKTHIEDCPVCAEEFYLVSQCIDACGSCPDFEEKDEYFEEFLISIHERISITKPKEPFPYKIIIPLAAGALGTIGVVYLLFFRPTPKETTYPLPQELYKDPIYEVYELSPDEQQEFIKRVNQKYFGE